MIGLLRNQECGFVSASPPDFTVRNEVTPNFAILTSVRIFGVRPAINDHDAISVNNLADGFMWTDAFLLRHQRRYASHSGTEREEEY